MSRPQRGKAESRKRKAENRSHFIFPFSLAHQQIATLMEEAQQARSAAIGQARQEGELAALRQQLHDQTAFIERLTQKR